MTEMSGTRTSVENMRKTCIKLMSRESSEYYAMIDRLEFLKEKYNAYSKEDRVNNPEAWVIEDEWRPLTISKRLKENQLCSFKEDLLFLTEGNIELWPRHLKRHHTSNANTEIIDDVPVAKEAAAGGDACFICLSNVPDAKFNECGHSGVCCECADSVIRRGMACPLCRVDVFDFTVAE